MTLVRLDQNLSGADEIPTCKLPQLCFSFNSVLKVVSM